MNNELDVLPEPFVRQATQDDLPKIVELVEEFVKLGHLLPRTPEAIAEKIDTWLVAVYEEKIVGIASLLVYSPVLAEVRSLAVLKLYRQFGLGRMLVEGLIAMAKERNIPTLFALTRVVPFFEKLDFVVTEKERFPEKIWTACQKCPIQDNCDETAVVLELL